MVFINSVNAKSIILISDSIFIGEISVSYKKIRTDKGMDWYFRIAEAKAALRKEAPDYTKWKEDYQLGLIRNLKYFINVDTLIMISTNMRGDTITSIVQIKKDCYVKNRRNEAYSKLNIPNVIESVHSWREIQSSFRNNQLNIRKYSGNYQDAINNISVDHSFKFNYQSTLPFNYKDIFFLGGIIINKNQILETQGSNLSCETANIKQLPINCKEMMARLSFSPNEYQKPLTVNRIFYASDTVLLDTNLRSKANINFHLTNKDSVVLEDLPGNYKYVAFVHNKYDTKKLKNDLKDLTSTYQNKNIKFYIVELNENISDLSRASIKEKNRDTAVSEYYFKPGIRHPLFAKIDFVVYPIYFLFDKEGRIVLVEAPPPNDPNLCSVFNRLE